MSPSMQGATLPLLSCNGDAPIFGDIILPDGRPGRIVAITFSPRREDSNSHIAPRIVTIALARQTTDLHQVLARTRRLLAAVCMAALVLALVLLAFMVRRGLRPVSSLSEQIGDVGEDDLSARIEEGDTPAELMPIVDRLNDLLDRLEAALHRQRCFTGNVAHELRTPLAGLRAKLELALSRDRDPEDYRRFLVDCAEINRHMRHIVETLLHLARLDSRQTELRVEPIEIDNLVSSCWSCLQAQASVRAITFTKRTNGADESVSTDRDSLRLVIHNVLENAVCYAKTGGTIGLTISRIRAQVSIVVQNPVDNPGSIDPQRIFDRFWRADSSWNGRQQLHMGLGLPLCRAVMGHLGGSIEAAITSPDIFTIKVTLPACLSR